MIKVIKKKDNFPQLRAKAPDVAARITESNVKGGVQLLIGIMPEDTGEMKRQTSAVPVESGRSKGSWAIRIGVDYWPYVNDGTLYIEGQHFVEKAVESIRRGLDADFRNFESFLKV